ncbi:umecyanin-like [Durio zibethinus]|uniref:Umecyanin-like n=1 Tax=Durio zibethinus TaxID=66656 RepID=A0A6P5ZH56_DURZI|nr:umecyanin-like [Durio zibethinus]
MVRKISMAALFVVLAATLLQSTLATNYTVGDSTGWQRPTNNADFYGNWTKNKNFVVGDILVFDFPTGQHDVAVVTEASYNSCTATNAIFNYTNGPAIITLNTTGYHYYICGFSGHCAAGQKLRVDVQNGTNTPSTPGSSPNTPSGGSTPPNSASSLIATLPLIFMSIFLVLFCY